MPKLNTGNPANYGYPTNIFNIKDNTVTASTVFFDDSKAKIGIPFTSPRGEDRVLKRFTPEDLRLMESKYGKINTTSQGLSYYALNQVLKNDGIVYGMRLTPEDACFANNVLTLSMKNTEKAVFYIENGNLTKTPKVLNTATPILLPSIEITYKNESYADVREKSDLELLLTAGAGSFIPANPDLQDTNLKVSVQEETVSVEAHTNKAQHNMKNATIDNTIVTLDGLILSRDKYSFSSEADSDGDVMKYYITLKETPGSTASVGLKVYTINGPMKIEFLDDTKTIAELDSTTEFVFPSLRSEGEFIVAVDGLIKKEGVDYDVDKDLKKITFRAPLSVGNKVTLIRTTSTMDIPFLATSCKGRGVYGNVYKVVPTMVNQFTNKVHRMYTFSVYDMSTGLVLETQNGAALHDVYTSAKTPVSIDDVFRTYSEYLNVINNKDNVFNIGDRVRGTLVNIINELDVIITAGRYSGQVIADTSMLKEFKALLEETVATCDMNADQPAINFIPVFDGGKGTAECFIYGVLPTIKLGGGHDGSLSNVRVFNWELEGTRKTDLGVGTVKFKVLYDMYKNFWNGTYTKDIYDTSLFPIDIAANVAFYPREIQDEMCLFGEQRIDVAIFDQLPYLATERECKEFVSSMNRYNSKRTPVYPNTFEIFDKDQSKMLRIGTVLGNLYNTIKNINMGFPYAFAGGDSSILTNIEPGTVKPELTDLNWAAQKKLNYISAIDATRWIVDGQSAYINDDETSLLCEVHNIIIIGRIIKKLNAEVTLKRHRFSSPEMFNKTVREINATLEYFRKFFSKIEYVAGYKDVHDAQLGRVTHNLNIGLLGTDKIHIFNITGVMPDFSSMMLDNQK